MRERGEESPPLGNDTHGDPTTKMGIGEEAGESYGKTSFLPVLRRMLKVILKHRETGCEGFTRSTGRLVARGSHKKQ